MIHFNSFLNSDYSQDSKHKTALIILNSTINSNSLRRIWENSAIRVCADGGANRLFNMSSSTHEEGKFIPDFICGDLDSIHSEVKNFYSSNGVELHEDCDQNTTDFQKTSVKLYELMNQRDYETGHTSEDRKWTVIVLGALGNRFDQEISNINMLFHWNHPSRLVLLSDENIIYLLTSGMNRITLTEYEGPICGLLPIGNPSGSLHTSGLKWNLNGESLQFGTLISTSNYILENEVTVQTQSPIVWTCQVDLDRMISGK